MAVIRTIGKRKFFRRAVLNGHFRMTLRRLFFIRRLQDVIRDQRQMSIHHITSLLVP